MKDRTSTVSKEHTFKQIYNTEEAEVLRGVLLGFSVFPFHPTANGAEQYEMERVIWALRHSTPLLSDLDCGCNVTKLLPL